MQACLFPGETEDLRRIGSGHAHHILQAIPVRRAGKYSSTFPDTHPKTPEFDDPTTIN